MGYKKGCNGWLPVREEASWDCACEVLVLPVEKHHLRVETRLNIEVKRRKLKKILENFIRFLCVNNRNISTSYSLNGKKRNGELIVWTEKERHLQVKKQISII